MHQHVAADKGGTVLLWRHRGSKLNIQGWDSCEDNQCQPQSLVLGHHLSESTTLDGSYVLPGGTSHFTLCHSLCAAQQVQGLPFIGDSIWEPPKAYVNVGRKNNT